MDLDGWVACGRVFRCLGGFAGSWVGQRVGEPVFLVDAHMFIGTGRCSSTCASTH